MAEIGNDILKAQEFLERNHLVAIPTETVYGLASNAFNPIAVAKIFEAKERPTFDPLIVHTYDLKKVYDFVTEIHPSLLKLAETFWPGPLTLLLPKKEIILLLKSLQKAYKMSILFISHDFCICHFLCDLVNSLLPFLRFFSISCLSTCPVNLALITTRHL